MTATRYWKKSLSHWQRLLGSHFASRVDSSPAQWCWFCLVVICAKLLLLMLDPSPKFYMGDSRSYIATAVTGWIPPDRSFFYGYVIRWLAV
ncbi:MAG TPA: hypothetical protein VJK31_10130, partial [Chthoniobacterales bacterium]|nr:hypothetical protein [Chthoniobacterales bacterium]